MQKEAELLKALAHPVRLALLEGLCEGEECVCHLACLVDRRQPYVSRQLAELREAGLVADRRDGLRIFYRLANPGVAGLLEAARVLSGRPAPSGRRSLADCPCPRCK